LTSVYPQLESDTLVSTLGAYEVKNLAFTFDLYRCIEACILFRLSRSGESFLGGGGQKRGEKGGKEKRKDEGGEKKGMEKGRAEKGAENGDEEKGKARQEKGGEENGKEKGYEEKGKGLAPSGAPYQVVTEKGAGKSFAARENPHVSKTHAAPSPSSSPQTTPRGIVTNQTMPPGIVTNQATPHGIATNQAMTPGIATSPPSARGGGGRIAEIEGLRVVAAVHIVVFHMFQTHVSAQGASQVESACSFCGFGKYWVCALFTISGLASALAAGPGASSTVTWHEFWRGLLRRVAPLMPLVWLSLLLTAVGLYNVELSC
jgi:hypothetical protein